MAYRRRYRSRPGRTSSFRRGFAVPRQNVWVRELQVSGVGPVANYSIILVNEPHIDAGARLGSTVIRTHVAVELLGAELSSATGGLFFGIAMMDVSQFSDLTQPPVLPVVPGTGQPNNGADWAYWNYVPVSEMKTLAIPNAAPTTRNLSYRIDAKSKRRFTEQHQNFVFVLQNNSISGTTGVALVTSTLVKLS